MLPCDRRRRSRSISTAARAIVAARDDRMAQRAGGAGLRLTGYDSPHDPARGRRSARRWSRSSTPRSAAAWSSSDMVRRRRRRRAATWTSTIALTVAGCPMKVEPRGAGAARTSAPCRRRGGRRSRFDVMTPEQRAALRTRLQGAAPQGEERAAIALDPRTRVIAVASGKGGVGKSTLTVNLALALRAGGAEVGVVDADIYGYSIPGMLGIQQRPVVVDKMIVPPVAHDLKVMSIGFFLERRGSSSGAGRCCTARSSSSSPTSTGASSTTCVVDMPPGTGDVALSLGQLLPRPRPGARHHAAARRAAGGRARRADGRARLGQPLVGVVENMSQPRLPVLRRGARTRSARAAARRWPTSSACRCSARCRWTSRCARAADSGDAAGRLALPDAASSRAVAELAERLPGVAAGRCRPPCASASRSPPARSRRLPAGGAAPPGRSSRPTGRAAPRGSRCRPTPAATRARSVRAARSSPSASWPSIGRNSSAGVLPNSRSWMPWSAPARAPGRGGRRPAGRAGCRCCRRSRRRRGARSAPPTGCPAGRRRRGRRPAARPAAARPACPGVASERSRPGRPPPPPRPGCCPAPRSRGRCGRPPSRRSRRR